MKTYKHNLWNVILGRQTWDYKKGEGYMGWRLKRIIKKKSKTFAKAMVKALRENQSKEKP